MRAEQIGIAHAFLAERADEHGLCAVETIPLAAIRADGKINLLGHRRLFAGEGDEQKSAVGGEGGAGEGGQKEKEEALHVFLKVDGEDVCGEMLSRVGFMSADT